MPHTRHSPQPPPVLLFACRSRGRRFFPCESDGRSRPADPETA